MPTEEELLAAVAANPEDDAPRLAHADWLEQNGDPDRAAVIRLQLRAAQPGLEWSLRYGAESQATPLVRKHWKRWLPGMPQVAGLSWEWSRGYPAVLVVTDTQAFRDHGAEALRGRLPVVRLVGAAAPGLLADCAALALVQDLRLDVPQLGDDALRALVSSPQMASLRALRVRWGRLTGAALAHLAGAAVLAGLEELELRCGFTASPSQAELFAGALCMAGLRGLWLEDVVLGSKAGPRFWGAFGFRQLGALRVSSAKLGAAGMAGFAGARLSSLRSLSLHGNRLGDAGAAIVAGAPALAGLRELDLSANLIGQGGAEALAGAAHLAGLERLDLRRNAIPDAGAARLAEAPHLAGLTHLDLSGNLIGDAGLLALGRSFVLGSLTQFQARDNPARQETLEKVARRFRERLRPLQEEVAPAVPAPASAAPATVIGAAEEDGLVRAILADPRDVLARSAYADWLEEQGKPLHAELLRLGGKGERAKAILAEVAGALAGSTLTVDAPEGLLSARVMLRSFISQKFGEDAPVWLRGQNVVEVRIKGKARDWAKVGAAPAMAHVRALSLQGLAVSDTALTRFAAAVGGGPCALCLRDTFCKAAGVAALARSAGLAGLARLDLANTHPGPDGLRALTEGPMGQGLQHLVLSNTSPGSTGIAFLARGAWPALVTLSLRGNGLGDTAAQALAATAGMPRLRNLDLSCNSITEAGARALVESPLFARLRWLRLTENALGVTGWQLVARAVAAVPGCVLSVSKKGLSEARLAEFREMLGNRLVQE